MYMYVCIYIYIYKCESSVTSQKIPKVVPDAQVATLLHAPSLQLRCFLWCVALVD